VESKRFRAGVEFSENIPSGIVPKPGFVSFGAIDVGVIWGFWVPMLLFTTCSIWIGIWYLPITIGISGSVRLKNVVGGRLNPDGEFLRSGRVNLPAPSGQV
jgi:hypothetical protein